MSAPNRYTRRFALRAAVLGVDADPWARPPLRERTVISGRVVDVSPHVLVLQTATGEQRLTLTPETRAWRGGAVRPVAIKHGDQVVLRTARHPQAVERVWAQIGRVTGTIVESRGRELVVDEGPDRGRQVVVIDAGSMRQVQVKFPRIAPGYLIDLIGVRRPGCLLALTPATAQPPYLADHPPMSPLVNGHVPDRVSGTAVWHDQGTEPPDLRGVAYPMLDPETSCEEPVKDCSGPHSGSPHSGTPHSGSPHGNDPHEPDPHGADPHGVGPGCVRLPYLSVGSSIRLRNECSDLEAVLPVTSCGAASRLFCDRCVECGTSPRGRIADLTMTAFAELGGDLEYGCFNATLTVPG